MASGGEIPWRFGSARKGKANVLGIQAFWPNLERAFLEDPEGLNRLRLSISASGLPRDLRLLQVANSRTRCSIPRGSAAFFAAVLQGDRTADHAGQRSAVLPEPAQNYAAAYLAWIDAALARCQLQPTRSLSGRLSRSCAARSPSIQWPWCWRTTRVGDEMLCCWGQRIRCAPTGMSPGPIWASPGWNTAALKRP